MVVVRDSEAGEKRLVAYLVVGSRGRPTASALRRSLAEKLPEYMMPSAMVFLDALPLNASGKVDLGALADPGADRSDLEEPYVAPRTDTEKALAELWASLLEVGQVGVNDRFLDLGGNSLQAMRMISRLRETFRVDLNIRALFQAPTIGEMAVVIDQSQTDSDRTASNQEESADE